MKQFIVWIFVFSLLTVGCESKKTADEYYSSAELERNAKNINLSLEYLESLIKNYPEHALAPQAQYLIGDIYMNDLRDFDNAIQSYQKVVDNFIGSDKEAEAQFMVGYVHANYLSDFESATASYELFLQKFPNHELAPSVQFEMDNLGRDINEIPVLKHITS